jgi:pimeloyl-ACP methyl ester carboxylesterase
MAGLTEVSGVVVHRSVVPAATVAPGLRRPLLLLAGVGTPVGVWSPLRERLSTRTTVAFDVPGIGASPFPRWPLGLGALADLSIGLLDELGVEDADVLGYSFGGAVAQELARRHPHRLGALVLVSTSCGWGGTPGNLLALAAPGSPLLDAGPAERDAPGAGGAEPTARRSRMEQAWVDQPPNPLGVWWQGAAIAAWSSWAWLPDLVVPTLVVTGGQDPIVPPANGRTIAARIPGSELVVLPDLAHFALLADDPSPVAAVIEAFLARHDPDVAPADST